MVNDDKKNKNWGTKTSIDVQNSLYDQNEGYKVSFYDHFLVLIMIRSLPENNKLQLILLFSVGVNADFFFMKM